MSPILKMCPSFAIALASVVIYDHKWRHNLEHHLLTTLDPSFTTLESSFTSVICLWYSGLYYKHMTIVNDDSSVVRKWSHTLINDARIVIYDRNVFIIQATGLTRNVRLERKNLEVTKKKKKSFSTLTSGEQKNVGENSGRKWVCGRLLL